MESDKCYLCNSNTNPNDNSNTHMVNHTDINVNKINIKTKLHQMSCNHFYCTQCLIQQIILKHITQLQFNKPIKAICKCFKEGFIELPITQLESLSSQFLSQASQDNNSIIDNPNANTCSIHPNEKLKMYCKDCLFFTCIICSRSEPHFQHQIITKEEIYDTLHTSIKTLPLRFKTSKEFTTSFNESINSFKTKVNEYLNEQLKQIDSIIAQMTILRQEYITMTKNHLEQWDHYLNLLKDLYSYYFSSYEQSDSITNFNDLKFISNIRNAFKKLKIRVNDQNNQQMKDILKYIEDMKTNTKDVFDIEIKYNELPKNYHVSGKLFGHKGQIYAAIQLRDGRICTGADDYTIRFWEKVEGQYKNTYTISEYTGEVESLLQLKDNRILSCSKDNNAFRIWIEKENSGRYTCGGTLSEHSFAVTSLYELSNNKLISTSEDHSIKIWVTHQNLFQCSQTIKEHSQTVYSAIEILGKRLASASADCSIRIWEEVNGVFFSTHIIKTQKRKIKTLRLLKDGVLACGGKDGVLLFWKENGEEFECVYSVNAMKSDIVSIIQLQDNRLVTVTKDGVIRLWMKNVHGWNDIEELNIPKKNILCAIELSDGMLVSTTNDRLAYLWKNCFYLD